MKHDDELITDGISRFFTSHSNELKSKMKRLDYIVGRDHWLSVGHYKEELLRSLLRQLLPKKYEVCTGFILTLDEDGNEIKSKQQDIIIWNSYEYAAIFRDGDFVIVPPEACRAVIEVKSKLTKQTMAKALSSTDAFWAFIKTPLCNDLHIAKYIFAYDSSLSFPTGYFDAIFDFYENDVDGQLSLDQRVDFTSANFPNKKFAQLATIDGIFVLGGFAILRDINYFSQGVVKFVFNAFELASNGDDHTYSFFEHTLNTVINSPCDSAGMYYAKQPGLFSLMQKIELKQPELERVMIYPYTDDVLSRYKNMPLSHLYRKISSKHALIET
ncbi:hypothetical protein K0W35_004416 [Vibrio parahaemolyticus]|nr:hypothetical protein [Vibrio parahaemolyticus]